jgi:hypothetical protein
MLPILMFYTTSVKAQKAYAMISYKAIIYGSQANLQLADGYILASKVTIFSKLGNQVFSPSASEPDSRGNLRFDVVEATGRLKNNKGSWLKLEKINGSAYPLQIKSVYWDSKVQKNIVFKKRYL